MATANVLHVVGLHHTNVAHGVPVSHESHHYSQQRARCLLCQRQRVHGFVVVQVFDEAHNSANTRNKAWYTQFRGCRQAVITVQRGTSRVELTEP